MKRINAGGWPGGELKRPHEMLEGCVVTRVRMRE
jgi:hypothetical protein